MKTIFLYPENACSVIYKDISTQIKSDELTTGHLSFCKPDSKCFWQFDISSIPRNISIEEIWLKYEILSAHGKGVDAYFDGVPHKLCSTAHDLWTAASGGRCYYNVRISESNEYDVGKHQIKLNSLAKGDLQSYLKIQEWFTISSSLRFIAQVNRSFDKNATLIIVYENIRPIKKIISSILKFFHRLFSRGTLSFSV